MELFETLNKVGLSKTSFSKTIWSWKTDELNRFVELINLVIDSSKTSDNKSGFSFVANSQLSGGTNPCTGIDCRFSSIDQLARNSLLYADKVYIQNFFNYHEKFKKINNDLKIDIINSVGLLHYIKPLLEEGIIEICSSKHHFCPECYQNIIVNKIEAFDNKLNTTEKYLFQRFLKDSEFILQENYGQPAVYVDGPQELFNHQTILSFRNSIPKNLLSIYNPKRRIKLKQKDIKAANLATGFVYQILDDLQYQNYYVNITNAKYLTGRELDLKILSKINSNTLNIKSNAIYHNLSHTVPFIENVKFSSLLKFRKKEGEAFKVYRDSLDKLLRELDETDPKKIKQALNDVIQPELNKMDQTIKNSKKLIWSNITKDVLIGGSFIGISLFSGILPANIGQIVSALGGIRYAEKFGDNILNLIKDSTDSKDNNYYFLWKLKQQAKKLS